MSLNGLEIAVIGMAGRFPGAEDIDRFWENLENGTSSITFFTDDELESLGITPGQYTNPKYVRAFAMLEDIEYFDSDFFDYTPREADIMDPQVRLFHEYSWKALEDAACVSRSYNGLIGLYAGSSNNFGWEAAMHLSGKFKGVGAFAAQQLMNRDFLCTRVAYKLDLKGPASFQQTACSTSLVAIHAACQGILNGECDIALAGGVTVSVPKQAGYLHQEGMIFSPDGHCRAFDERAQGVFGGNGVGVVVLKRLEDAKKDRDFIYAVIKGSAINNDGFRKIGFTAPSIEGQADVIITALEMAEVEPESIGFIECHGTGTALGDPVELKALEMAFDSEDKQFCALASVKTNVGHLDCAAGVTGFIKAVLALHNKAIPASLHYESPNPTFDLKHSPFYINTGLKKWLTKDSPRRAGVSSFGIGGTNAHVILEEAPADEELSSPAVLSQDHLLLMSAKSQSALDAMSINLSAFLKKNAQDSILEHTAYTLQVGREAFRYRRMLVCTGIQDAINRLADPVSAAVPTRMAFEGDVPVVFMFSGQGAQYVKMGLDIYNSIPLFKEEMDRCFGLMNDLTGENYKAVLYPEQTTSPIAINNTRFTQPLLFAFEYALARQLISWGIVPTAMIGHSIGEYVAACISGVLELNDALRLVIRRGELMSELPEGAMLSVEINEDLLMPLLLSHPEVSLAAANSTDLCTVSGPAHAITLFESELKQQDPSVKSRRLRTSHAFHSAMMEPMLNAFEEELRSVSFSAPKIPYLSNLTGDWMTGEDALDARYWLKHIRQGVRFNQGLELLFEEEPRMFVEVGPGQGLATFVRKHCQKKDGHSVVNLIRHPTDHTPDRRFLINQMGQLWLYGVDVNWDALHEGRSPRRIPLPTYPFDKIHYPFPVDVFSSSAKEGNSQLDSFHLTDTNDPSSWFYLPAWKQSLQSGTDVSGESGGWLIFADNTGLAQHMVETLKLSDNRVITVSTGESYTQSEDNHFTLSSLSSAESEDYIRLFESIPGFGEGEKRWKVVHMWTVSTDSPGIDLVLNHGYYCLVELAKAMGKLNIQSGVDLIVVTNEGYMVTGDENCHPANATIYGLVKILSDEYSFLRSRLIDIQLPEVIIDKHSELIDRLVHDCLNFPSQNAATVLSAYRGFSRLSRWERYWQPVKLEPASNPSTVLKENGVYLISGGLGGIGFTLAKSMAAIKNVKLVLIGRSEITVEKQEMVKQLEDLGAEVLVLCADTADEEQMKKVLGTARQRFGLFNGVIHAAGVADGCINQQRSREISEPVMAPKINGTIILDRLLMDEPLDFAVLCSSLASILAPVGQSAYSAANAFMDAYAGWRQIHTRRAGKQTRYLSIAWDSWREVGMAEAAAGDRLGDYGIKPSEGVDVFERLLTLATPLDRETLWAVSIRDLNHLLHARNPLPNRENKEHSERKDIDAPTHTPGKIRPRPELSIPYIAPRDEREQALSELWSGYLGLEKVGVNDNFFELGATSLDIIHLNNRLEKILERQLPVVTMFTYPTIDALSSFLKQEGDNTQFTPEEQERLESSGSRQRNKLKQRKRNVDRGNVDDESV